MGQGLYASALSAASDPTHNFDLVYGPTSNLDGPLIKQIVQFIEPNFGPYLKWSVMKRCRSLCITTRLLPKNKPADLPVVLFPFIDLVKLSVCSGILAFDQHLKVRFPLSLSRYLLHSFFLLLRWKWRSAHYL